ncbi:hypothetical protein [Pseudoalteromonas denitrificans]|uniref:Uncharacterized protein n=1 Tax=Pseudoalteromonas denitrificans DSM 6059 TaxID=1123010 RepID=A0A1I1IJL0_9GAMM|nr:hypothetical protein [Pseudoalteromonas denitrificans]SFC36539.1 hypothetical protein SAMN02745724_01509 [Pseudoalteromonas denitrificans DSM 6059]
MMPDNELNQIISLATDEQLASLYKHYDNKLTEFLNNPDSTEEQINLIADKLLTLSTIVDTTVSQPMELNPEFTNKQSHY